MATYVISDDGGGNFTTIQAAINAAVAGDVLQVTGGADRIHTEQGIFVNKSLTISGTAGATQVIVQAHAQAGMASDRVFRCEFARVGNNFAIIDNLTIRHGNTSGEGGGILNLAPLNVTNSTISGNSAVNGGGISNSGALYVTNSTISGNVASATVSAGGGLYTRGQNAVVMNSTVSNNIGSGVYGRVTVRVENSTISGNSTAGSGGGVGTKYGGLTIRSSTITGNTAQGNAGGVYNRAILGSMYMSNSTISGNLARGNGGGIASLGRMTVTNSTIVGNTTGASGGGIFNQGTQPQSARVFNTIIAGSSGRDVFGTDTFSGGNNLVQDGMAPAAWTNTIIGDPLLGTLEDNGGPTKTHALLAGSPAIDAGNNAFAVDGITQLTTDQRGKERRVGTVDIGAFEFRPSMITVTTLVDETDGINVGGISLREAISAIDDGGTIVFDPALANGTIQLTNGELLIRQELSIDGGSNSITINAQGNSRVFRIDDGTENRVPVSLNGLTIRGGAVMGSTERGGGILNLEDLRVARSTIVGNIAETGGGIANLGTLRVVNSTLSGNTGRAAGGGIVNLGAMTVTNSTIVGNSALFTGGGIFNQPASSATLNNTLVAGNIGGDLAGSGTFSGTNNLVQDGSGTGLTGTITGDPMLSPLQNNGGPTETYVLLNGSPALNAGQNSVAVDDVGNPLSIDQRGRQRFVGTVDIGAVEMATLSIAADQASVSEGTGGVTNVTFTVTLNGTVQGVTTVNYAVGGANVETSDFDGGSFPTGMVSFDPGETQKTITIAVAADSVVEAAESFTVMLSNASVDTAIVISQASSIITNDDSATLTLAGVNASRAEGDGGGQTAFTFSVALSHAVEGGLNVGYTTNDGTATLADNDYLDNDGSLTFTGTAGETRMITVMVNQDTIVEANDRFAVALGAISGLGPGIELNRITIAGSPQEGTIVNDDIATLVLAGVNASQLEGTGSSPTVFRFSVTLDNAVQGGFQVAYTTNDGPLTPDPNIGIATVADSDYQDNDGTLTFLGIASERLFIDVLVNADAKVEATELFNVVLGAITGLGAGIHPGSVKLSDSLDDRQQVGTILNNLNGLDDDNSLLNTVFIGIFPSLNGGDPVARFEVTSSNAVQGGFELELVVDASTAIGPSMISRGLTLAAGASRRTGQGSFRGNPGERQLIDVPIPPLTELLSALVGTITPLEVGVSAGDIIPGALLEVTVPSQQLFVTAAGPGGGPHVRVFNSTDFSERLSFFAYDARIYTGGVRVAVGDVNGDGTPDIITGTGPGGGPHVKVFDGTNGAELYSFFAFGPTFFGGSYMGAADFTGDGRAEIIVGADAGGNSHVKVFNVNQSTTTPLFSFYAYGPGFFGGVRVAAGDVNGDGTPDIITGAGVGGRPHIRIFDGSVPQETTTPTDLGGPVGSFYAFVDTEFFGGVFVSSGDFNGDNRSDIVVGAGPGGGPLVRIISGADGSELIANYAYQSSFTGGVYVAVTIANGDNRPDLIVGPGRGGNPVVSVQDLIAGNIIRSFEPFGRTFAGGVFVGGSLPQPIATSPSNNFLALRVDAEESPTSPSASLEQSAIQPLIDEAIDQFEQAGLAASESLSEVSIEIADLEGDLLGEVIGDTIRLDRDAAGFGWFIDPTPVDDVEFKTANPEVLGRVDLLTVLAHELGHILGLTHHNNEPNFMSERLALGTRHRIEVDDLVALDSVFSNHAVSDLME